MSGIRAFGDIWQARLVNAVCRAAFQDKAPVAIAAIDIAVLIDLKIDAWMAERRRAIIRAAANVAGAVAADPAGLDEKHFWWSNVHGTSR